MEIRVVELPEPTNNPTVWVAVGEADYTKNSVLGVYKTQSSAIESLQQLESAFYDGFYVEEFELKD